jgi:hypothetical protein
MRKSAKTQERFLGMDAPLRWPVFLVTLLATACALLWTICAQEVHASDRVNLERVPEGGIQPIATLGPEGSLHLIYFLGAPKAGNIVYRRRALGGSEFSPSVRVNSRPGSAVAVGTVRGPQMALGREGKVHVAWMGSVDALPKGPGNTRAMLYARSKKAGGGFEEERNLVHHASGLDGGGAIAADGHGKVSVFWHASAGREGEDRRRVWRTTSTDDGGHFAPETTVWQEPTGACGCCGMAAAADVSGRLYLLYRTARGLTQRDMVLLTAENPNSPFRGQVLEKWQIQACPLSTSSIFVGGKTVAVAWQTKDQVAAARIDPTTHKASPLIKAPGRGQPRKHPAVAVAGDGRMILVWTEGMGWRRGGTLHWQVFDPEGKASGPPGHTGGVVAWNRPAVVVDKQGTFTIFY